MKAQSSIVGAVLFLLTPHAHAANLPQEVVDNFYVTLEEVREHSRETYMAFAGSGGAPSRHEFVSTKLPAKIGPTGENSALLERLFGLLDANSDGKVTLEEWNTQINKDLSFADANGDGRITLKELSNARENMGVGDALSMIF